ncbi:MAG: hypothetical protein ACJAV5_001137 [Vicingaceae bacterium]|jgi:hypothetical protein
MRLLFFFVFLFTLFTPCRTVKAQPTTDGVTVLEMVVIDGDTFPMYTFKSITVNGSKRFSNRDRRRYGRLKRYVVKVFPYAELAGVMLNDFDDTLKTMNTEREQKKFLAAVEDELKQEFEGELKSLTIKQGILLVKLIDRQTGNSSFELIKTLRGSFSAFIWQSLARLFGSNLKLKYDPNGEDLLVEEIVQQMESGAIPYQKRIRKKKP